VEQRLEKYQQRLKSMASQLILAEEQTRRRIAADLHDHIGQSLALMRLQLAATRKDLPEGSTQDVQLADISQSLLNAIHDTRHLIFELSSPSLNELGLGPAIAEWIEENAKNKSGPRVNLVDESQDTPLTQNLRAILFRNIRELLTNTIKHANAKSVSILLEGTAGQLTVTIQDNGRGFDPDDSLSGANSGGGYGLFSIHERMSDLGGSFEIVSLPGMGCKAVLNVPINVDIQAMQA
jgi:signal transduction histidine kinase